MKQKGFAPILIVLIFSAIFALAGAGYWYSAANKKAVQEEVVCTMEAKLCPDGSSVGRSGPNCEFAPCPEENKAQLANPASVYCEKQGGKLEIRTGADGGQTGFCKLSDGSECEEWAYFRGECGQTKTDVSGWQTYRNEEFGFEMKYPKDWYSSGVYGGKQTPFGVDFSDDKNFIEYGPMAPGQPFPDKYINFVLYKTDQTIDEYISQDLKARNAEEISKKNIIIAGRAGVITETKNKYKTNLYAYVKKGEYIYILETMLSDKTYRAEVEKIFNSILSSLKFLN
jgi:putative hemolysin